MWGNYYNKVVTGITGVVTTTWTLDSIQDLQNDKSQARATPMGVQPRHETLHFATDMIMLFQSLLLWESEMHKC